MATASRERNVLQSGLALVSALLLGVGGLVFGVALTGLVGLLLVLGFDFSITPVRTLVLGLITVQGIAFPLIAFAYVKLRPTIGEFVHEKLSLPGRQQFSIGVDVPDLRDLGVVVLGYGTAIGGLIVASIVISIIVAALGVEPGRNQAAEIGMENPEVLLLLIPASFLLIGPGEELLFRGVVQGRIREVFGPVPSVVTASVFFAGIHYFALTGGSASGNLVALGGLLIPSLVLGAAYEYTDNIVVPSLIHGAYNATLFSLLYVVVKYSDQLEAAGAATLAPGVGV
ncbi:CPBP family intramembrane glutamic endopeptidase [Haloarcula salina]|uniref:CPBP family intramembrane metalloprotease n=1 Tax=Haloarcula salina TaxID=1429914 RepID=A0AA41G0J0_9EURY|nr:CPBP family intramembrane glutamic endopeptidase [Haloarcula salina]MBV0901231.1 CPBP family intramembrane metalloprotease [Haloarcula salina]